MNALDRRPFFFLVFLFYFGVIFDGLIFKHV
jgi:hypothetical protein